MAKDAGLFLKGSGGQEGWILISEIELGLREVPGALCTGREHHMEASGLLLSECFPSNLLTCRPILGQTKVSFYRWTQEMQQAR